MGLLFRVRLHTGLLFFRLLVWPVQSTVQSPSNDHASRALHAPLIGWPHLIQPGEEFYSKHWVSRQSFRLLILSLGFLSIPSILSNHRSIHLPIAEQAQILIGESAGFSIGDKSQVSFPLVLQLSSHHFRFHDEAIFRGLRGCFWWRLSSQANGNLRGEGGD